MNIQGKIALVTGASGGIGKAIAGELVARGARVALASRRLPELQAIVQEWSKAHPSWAQRLFPVTLDVQSEQSCREAVAAVGGHWGGLDILVNNAGFGLYGPTAAASIEEAKGLFDTNYFGACRMVLAALPALKRSGQASIAMISSIAGTMGVPWMSHYGATKAAMNNWSESLRIEFAPYSIHVLAVLPGMTKTSFGVNSVYVGGGRIPTGGMVGHSADFVARVTCDGIEKGRRYVIVGWNNRLLVMAWRLFAPVAERVMARLFGPWDGEGEWARGRGGEGK